MAKNSEQRKIHFLKNEAKKLLKIKDRGQKRTENEPKTKLPKLLKIRQGRKNEPKAKLAKLLKIRNRKKTNRRNNPARSRRLIPPSPDLI